MLYVRSFPLAVSRRCYYYLRTSRPWLAINRGCTTKWGVHLKTHDSAERNNDDSGGARNSISLTTYLFCHRVAACRGHWEGTPNRWYYCNARTLARTAPASHERPRHALAGRRVLAGSYPRHLRFRCEREALDVAEHNRTCPMSNNKISMRVIRRTMTRISISRRMYT